jgi:hypothetical protein
MSQPLSVILMEAAIGFEPMNNGFAESLKVSNYLK